LILILGWRLDVIDDDVLARSFGRLEFQSITLDMCSSINESARVPDINTTAKEKWNWDKENGADLAGLIS
jgi:hypothetical protein